MISPCFDFPLFYIKCTSRLLKSAFWLSDCIFQCPCCPYQGPKQLSGQFRASYVQLFLKSSAKLSAKWVCPAFSFVRIITFAESNPLCGKQWIELWLIYSGYLSIRHLKKSDKSWGSNSEDGSTLENVWCLVVKKLNSSLWLKRNDLAVTRAT